MKKLISIILLLSLFSCNNNDNEIKEFLNSGNEEILENIENQNDMYFYMFECAYAENPKIIKIYKDEVDTINLDYKFLIDNRSIIKETENKNIPKNSVTAKKIKTKYNYKPRIHLFTDSEINSITEKFKFNLLKYSKENQELNNKLLEILNFDVFKNKKKTYYEKNLFNYKISNAVCFTFGFLYKKIVSQSFEFNYFVPTVIPENYWIKPNEYFKAQLGFTFIDTIHNFTGIIENDSIYFKKSVAYYTFCPDSIGKYQKSGNVFIESPSTGELSTYPFSFEFKVIENE